MQMHGLFIMFLNCLQQCSRNEIRGSPQYSHKQHILQTPPVFLVLQSNAYRAMKRILILKVYIFTYLWVWYLDSSISSWRSLVDSRPAIVCGLEVYFENFSSLHICLQLEELATLQFYWLTFFCLSTRILNFQSDCSFVFRWLCFCKRCQM